MVHRPHKLLFARLPPQTAPIKQLLPAVPAFLREAKSLSEKTFTSRILAKCVPNLDLHNMEESGFGNPPMVEPSLAVTASRSSGWRGQAQRAGSSERGSLFQRQ